MSVSPGQFLRNPSGSTYLMKEKLGSGQYGTVWKARSRGFLYAIKVIPLSRVKPERFTAEVEILRELKNNSACDHGILCYDESWVGSENYFLVTEFISGPDLFSFSDQVASGKIKISAEEIRQVLISLAESVAYMHNQGIAHRDIKPENIHVDTSALETTLLDLGFSCFTTSDFNQCESNEKFGSIYFMAPEFLWGRVDDFFDTDIYALGITFFETVMGKEFFSASTTEQVMKDIKSGNHEKIRTGNLHLDVLLTQMTARSHLQRPAADEVVKSLRSQTWDSLPILS